MNSVEPIRDAKLISDIADYLKERNVRDYVLFLMGIYAPIRISDLLKLKVRDVRGKTHISIREQKTGKEQLMPINKVILPILKSYMADKEDYEYMFPSRESGEMVSKPITRQRAWQIIRGAAATFGLHRIGCHTLRKTFGYHFYLQYKDIMALQEIYNHPDPNTTKRYIGLIQDKKNEILLNFEYR